jgi:serine/threonine protein kinase
VSRKPLLEDSVDIEVKGTPLDGATLTFVREMRGYLPVFALFLEDGATGYTGDGPSGDLDTDQVFVSKERGLITRYKVESLLSDQSLASEMTREYNVGKWARENNIPGILPCVEVKLNVKTVGLFWPSKGILFEAWLNKKKRNADLLPKIFKGIFSALQLLWKKGYVHGSLTTEAVVIGNDGTPFLQGFEHAVLLGDSGTKKRKKGEKSLYEPLFSDKEAYHKDGSKAYDLFAFGVLLLRAELATGQLEQFETTREAAVEFVQEGLPGKGAKLLQDLVKGLVCPVKMDKIITANAVEKHLNAPILRWSPIPTLISK